MTDDVFSLTDDAAVANADGQKGADVATKEKAKPGRTAEGKSRLAEKAAQHAPKEEATAEPAKKVRGGTKPDQPRKKAAGGRGGAGAKSAAVAFGELPRGTLKTLEPSELTFDPDLQKRTAIFDEYTVEKYRERYEDAQKNPDKYPDPSDVLPPLDAIDTGETVYVWDGFQRGEAATRAGLKTIPVRVSKGTKEDAEFFALRANAQHGLARSSNDCRRAVYSVLDNPLLLERVDAKKEEVGGLVSALAIATGTSRGHVSNCLHQRGLTVRKGKLAKLPNKPDKPTTPATPAKAAPARANDTGAPNGGEPTIKAQPSGSGVGTQTSILDEMDARTDAAVDASKLTGKALIDHLNTLHTAEDHERKMQELRVSVTRVVVEDAAKTAAKLVRQVMALLERDEVAPHLYRESAKLVVPFGTREVETFPEFGSGASVPKITSVTVWPALESVFKTLETVRDVVLAQAQAEPAPAPAEPEGRGETVAETGPAELGTEPTNLPVQVTDPESLNAALDAQPSVNIVNEAGDTEPAKAPIGEAEFNPDFEADKPEPAPKASKYPAKKRPKAKAKK